MENLCPPPSSSLLPLHTVPPLPLGGTCQSPDWPPLALGADLIMGFSIKTCCEISAEAWFDPLVTGKGGGGTGEMGRSFDAVCKKKS